MKKTQLQILQIQQEIRKTDHILNNLSLFSMKLKLHKEKLQNSLKLIKEECYINTL